MERTEYDWWFVRKDAAIAAMQECIGRVKVDNSGYCYTDKHEAIAKEAVKFADALVKQLK